jgi:hypothetical protein
LKQEREERAARLELEQEHRQQYEEWCRHRTAGRIDELSPVAKQKIIRGRLSTFIETNRIMIDRRSWSETERQSWIEKRILVEYGREGQPTYEEWSRQNPLPTPTLTPTC